MSESNALPTAESQLESMRAAMSNYRQETQAMMLAMLALGFHSTEEMTQEVTRLCAELADLQHDIARHVKIVADLATELAAAQARIKELESHEPDLIFHDSMHQLGAHDGETFDTLAYRKAKELEEAQAALREAREDAAYYKWRLTEIIPLFEEARDALPAISLESAKLRNLRLDLGDRMDTAGTRSRAEWDAARSKEG